MPQFAANLSMLFTELPFLDRFEAAKAAGFTAVEYLFPYDHDRHHLAALLRKHGLRQVLHNLPAGDWAAGERGIACHPGRVAEFRQGVQRAIDYATALDCPRLNCLAGELRARGITLLVEPVNEFDIPGFFLTRTQQALDLIDAVGSDNLKLQYDIYHAQRMEGELGETLRRHLHRIGHIQIADNPGRGEPGTGEINYCWLFRHLDALGWRGPIGCEYKPRTTTAEGLGWLKEYTQ